MRRNSKKIILTMECIALIATRFLFLFLLVYYYSLLEHTEELEGFLIALTFTIAFWVIPIHKIVSY